MTMAAPWSHFELDDNHLQVCLDGVPVFTIIRSDSPGMRWEVRGIGTETVIDVDQYRNDIFCRIESGRLKPDYEAYVHQRWPSLPTSQARSLVTYLSTNWLFSSIGSDGEFDVLRAEWPDIPDDVFIGADTLFKPKDA